MSYPCQYCNSYLNTDGSCPNRRCQTHRPQLPLPWAPKEIIVKTEKYKHHGVEVHVISQFKGTHREHCLCHGCEKFKPGTADHCPIAQAVYENCVRHSIVTPMWECPEFEAS